MRKQHRSAWTKTAVAAIALITIALACAAPRSEERADAYVQEITAWRARRVENLKKPTGWLSLVGLYWLKHGENSFGADSTNAVAFPKDKAPSFMGTIILEDSALRVTVAPGVRVLHDGEPVTSMRLHHDQEKGFEPTVLEYGSLSWYPIERAERIGIRVKDSASSALREFKGIESYPVDRSWRVEGILEPHIPPQTVEITNVLGDVTQEPSPGTLVFDIDGKTYRLDPIAEPGEDELFVIFGDATSGKETYGGGRFLYVRPPDKDGKVVIDFNKAYNPPCVFTPFATCPLPPAQNHLPIAVRAGEKAYEKPGH